MRDRGPVPPDLPAPRSVDVAEGATRWFGRGLVGAGLACTGVGAVVALGSVLFGSLLVTGAEAGAILPRIGAILLWSLGGTVGTALGVVGLAVSLHGAGLLGAMAWGRWRSRRQQDW